MPVKLGSKLPAENAEARIEIIPLIDIMFFLLASFMLVSLSMVHMRSVAITLPTATTATPEARNDLLDISVDKAGGVFLDKKPLATQELIASLTAAHRDNPEVRVYISGDQDARHGDIIRVLDAVRTAGIDKVAFEIRPLQETAQP